VKHIIILAIKAKFIYICANVTVEGLRITTADVSVPENHNEFIVLTTNQDFNENADVIFSIPSGADIDKFGLDDWQERPDHR
jgi:hypothetical protein